MNEEDDVTIEENAGFEDFSDESIEEIEGQIDAKLKKAKSEIEALRKEKQEYLDGWQRSKADYVNALKRFEEERDAAKTQGKVSALKNFIPAYSALERAKEAGEVPEGFMAIAKQLETAFTSLGIVEFGAVGEVFDPMLHEALGMDETEDATKDDTVSAVFEKGYRINDFVVRPAKVRVATLKK